MNEDSVNMRIINMQNNYIGEVLYTTVENCKLFVIPKSYRLSVVKTHVSDL